MKRYCLTALLLIESSACGQEQANTASHTFETSAHKTTMDHQQSDETQIIDVTDKLAQWMIERDTAAMNRIVDKGFTLTHMTGYVQPKFEWFAEVEKESMKYYSAKKVNHSLELKGNRATFTQQNVVDARIWGSRNTWRLQQVYQLEKRGGNWIILSSVASVF